MNVSDFNLYNTQLEREKFFKEDERRKENNTIVVQHFCLSGNILWGASFDVENNTALQCSTKENSLYTYIENQLGPAVLTASMTANNCSKHRCSNHGTCWKEKNFAIATRFWWCGLQSQRRKWL